MFLQRFLLSLFFFYSLSIPAMAAQATFSWLPNSETNLAGYKVHYGTSSRNYINVTDVGLPDPVNGRVQTTVDNLAEGETYYFVATAYDSSGNESDFSEEIAHTTLVSKILLPPSSADSTVAGNEDMLVTGALDVTNPGGLPLLYTVKTNPAHGILTVENTTGQFSYSPQPDFNGLDIFSFTAANDDGVSNTATVTLTILPVNDLPTAQTGNFTADEDSTVSRQLSAEDIDGDTLEYILVSQPDNGAVTISTGGAFTYTPVVNWNGTDTFSFKVNDGTTDSNSSTVVILVNPVNDAPAADNQSLSIDAGSTITGLLTAVDQERDSITFTVNSTPTQGTVLINTDGSFTYTARQDATGNDHFTFTASDGSNVSTVATASITINPLPTSFRFELTEIQADSSWKSVNFESPFINPVVIARSTSFNNNETGVVRIKNITGTGLELRFQEWDYLDDRHPTETITLMVTEAGTFALDDATTVEAGCFPISGSSSFKKISYQQPMSVAPVVITAVNTFNGSDAVTTRVRNVTYSGFEFMMREQEANGVSHNEERACYLAWEPSSGSQGNMQYEVAVTEDKITGNTYSISYNSKFAGLPIPLAAMQTTDGGDTAVLRIKSTTTAGMNVLVSEEQSKDSETYHTTERGGYIAIASYNPNEDPDGDTLSTADEQNIYNTLPEVADTDQDGIDDGAEVTYWQEHGSSWDTDIDNDGLVNLLDQDADGDGMSDGSEITAGFDPADPASVSISLSMEGGEVEVDSSWVHVNFNTTFDNPVLIARLVSKNNSEPCVVRVDNVTGTGFDMRLQEYEYLDGSHPVELVSYLVMEAGHYTLADGTQVEAGIVSTNATSSYDTRRFTKSFSKTPVVISSVSSYNGSDAVTARIQNINPGQFETMLQEQEAKPLAHVNESLAYIAWEPSSGSENGIRYEVGRSADTVTHKTTTLSYATGFSALPLLYTDMQTADGGDTSTLRTLKSDTNSLQVTVEEEQSNDSEISHTTEVAGFIAILSE